MELLTSLFALVCGQNPGHTWAPGGVLLPCCQRCAGLYCGAGLALFLHLWLRPRLTANFLYVHGGFLLLMVPFGYHWVPQGPVLRTISGFLFGAGLMTFLWTPMAGSRLATLAWKSGQNFVRTCTVLINTLLKRRVNEKNRVRRTNQRQKFGKDQLYRLYAGTLVVGLFCLLMLAQFGGVASAALLSLGITWGALVIIASVLANAALGLTRMAHYLGLAPNREWSPVRPNRASGAEAPPT